MSIIKQSLLKHWRGEYGLARSFWVHGLGSTWLSNQSVPWFLNKTISIFPEVSPEAALIAISVIYAAIFIFVWGGIWNSAKKHDVKWQRIAAQILSAIYIGVAIASPIVIYFYVR